MKIVTISCDIYADTPSAFAYLLDKHWPDHPEIVFVTNSKKLNVDNPVYYFNSRDDMAFGWRLRQFLKQHYIDDYLLFMMSDYLVKSVNIPLIERAYQLCKQPDVRHVRLRPMPHPPFDYNDDFGRIDKHQRYALSLQPGIWETRVLYDLLRDTDDPWQTEVRGSDRVRFIRGEFLSTRKMAISHVNYYRKGKAEGANWVRENVAKEYWTDEAKKK